MGCTANSCAPRGNQVHFRAKVVLLVIALALCVPSPWNFLLVIAGIVGEIGEVIWGRRLGRRWRAKTGVEAMIGTRAEVVARLHPIGQVHIDGGLWEARSSAEADVDDTVVVRAMEGLTLVVEPAQVGVHPIGTM